MMARGRTGPTATTEGRSSALGARRVTAASVVALATRVVMVMMSGARGVRAHDIQEFVVIVEEIVAGAGTASFVW